MGRLDLRKRTSPDGTRLPVTCQERPFHLALAVLSALLKSRPSGTRWIFSQQVQLSPRLLSALSPTLSATAMADSSKTFVT
jgi:hypothetical protein